MRSSGARRIFKPIGQLFPLCPLIVFSAGGAWAAESSGCGGAATMTHRMMVFLIQLGVILFAGRLGSLLFGKLKMPRVFGALCAGILIGPFALGMIPFPGFPEGLFAEFQLHAVPENSLRKIISPELYGVCTFASVVLLFMTGLQTDLKLFFRRSFAGTLVGLGGVICSYIGGTCLGVFLLPTATGAAYTFLSPECVFLGILATATSVSIISRILAEQRDMYSPEGITILAGSAIDSVFSIILLATGIAVIGGSQNGNVDQIEWNWAGHIALRAFGIWVGVTTVATLCARKISWILKKMGGAREIAILSLGLALLLAGFFEKAQLGMFAGSFVMGISLARSEISHSIRERLRGILGLLLPIFFVVMGMLVDVHVLMDRKILLFVLAYTVAAILAKIAGCGLSAFLCGFNLRGAFRVGVGMAPRGEIALIIAGIGFSSGYLDSEIFAMAVAMILISALIAPLLYMAAFCGQKSGLRSGRGDQFPHADKATPVVYTFPNDEITELLMNSMLAGFAQEGFFAAMLNVGEGLCQARKNDILINFRHTGNQIIFEAPPRAEPVIRMLMLEAIVAFEQVLTELRRPMGADIRRELTEAEVVGVKRRKTLERILRPDMMVPELESTEKEDVIEELLETMVRHGLVKDKKMALESIFKREEAMSTGLREGIACPHARTDAVDRLVCAIGLKREGIDFDSVDESPSKIIVLTLSPASTATPYMELMSSMMSVLSDQSVMDALLACQTASEMLCVLIRKNQR